MLHDNDIIYSIFILKGFVYYVMLFVDAFDIIIRARIGRVEKVLQILLEKVKTTYFLEIKKYKLFRFMGQNIKSFKHFKLYE